MDETLALVAALIIMVIGLAGAIFPVLPGPALIWLGALLYAWGTSYASVGWPTLLILGLIALVATTSDFWVSAMQQRRDGTTLVGSLLSLVGGIIGLFTFGLPGMLIGTVIGLLIPNWKRWRERGYVFRISWTTVRNWLLSVIIQLGLGVIMIVIFLIQVFV